MDRPTWVMLHPRMTYVQLGYLPGFLDRDDPRPAREQLDTAYHHGGGWSPFQGFEVLKGHTLQYPGDDEPLEPLAQTYLHGETIVFYPHSWVAIWHKDGTFEISRMD